MGSILVMLFFMLCSLLLIQLASNTFMLGIYLLFLCFLVFLIFCFLNMLWYGLLFFLVYVGGMLVLFFYVFSLKPKPKFSSIFSKSQSFYIFFWMIFFFWLFSSFVFLDIVDSFLVSFLEEKSFFLFNGVEVYFVFFLGMFLVFILFVVSVITSSLKGALRPLALF